MVWDVRKLVAGIDRKALFDGIGILTSRSFIIWLDILSLDTSFVQSSIVDRHEGPYPKPE